MQTSPIQLVMSLSYLFFIIECTQSNRSRKLNSSFNVDRTYRLVMMFSCLVFLIDRIGFNLIGKLSFIFVIDRIYTIGHDVVMFGFHHRRHLVQSVITIQYHFCRRLYLSIRPCHCPIWFFHKPYQVKQVPIFQFLFYLRSQLYNRSRRCLVSFTTQIAHNLI